MFALLRQSDHAHIQDMGFRVLGRKSDAAETLLACIFFPMTLLERADEVIE